MGGRLRVSLHQAGYGGVHTHHASASDRTRASHVNARTLYQGLEEPRWGEVQHHGGLRAALEGQTSLRRSRSSPGLERGKRTLTLIPKGNSCSVRGAASAKGCLAF